MTRDIVKRCSRNPILTKADVPYAVETVHNAEVVKYRDDGSVYRLGVARCMIFKTRRKSSE